jgi:hypothetical protein
LFLLWGLDVPKLCLVSFKPCPELTLITHAQSVYELTM